MNTQIAKEIDAGMKNIGGRPEPAFKLANGFMGGGVVVWNSAKEVNGDYEKIALINCYRQITYYVENLPKKVTDYVKSIANGPNRSATVSQPHFKIFRED